MFKLVNTSFSDFWQLFSSINDERQEDYIASTNRYADQPTLAQELEDHISFGDNCGVLPRLYTDQFGSPIPSLNENQLEGKSRLSFHI